MLADISLELVRWLDYGFEIEHINRSQGTVKDKIIAKRPILNVMGVYPIY